MVRTVTRKQVETVRAATTNQYREAFQGSWNRTGLVLSIGFVVVVITVITKLFTTTFNNFNYYNKSYIT